MNNHIIMFSSSQRYPNKIHNSAGWTFHLLAYFPLLHRISPLRVVLIVQSSPLSRVRGSLLYILDIFASSLNPGLSSAMIDERQGTLERSRALLLSYIAALCLLTHRLDSDHLTPLALRSPFRILSCPRTTSDSLVFPLIYRLLWLARDQEGSRDGWTADQAREREVLC